MEKPYLIFAHIITKMFGGRKTHRKTYRKTYRKACRRGGRKSRRARRGGGGRNMGLNDGGITAGGQGEHGLIAT